MNVPLAQQANPTTSVEDRPANTRRVLVVLSEDGGQPSWITDGEDVEVAVVWSYEGHEDIPEAFRELALAYGFTPDEAEDE